MKEYYTSNGKNKLLREIAGPTTEEHLRLLKADRITLLRKFQYSGNNPKYRSYDGHDLLVFVGSSGPIILTLEGAKEFASAVYTAAVSIAEQDSAKITLPVQTAVVPAKQEERKQ